MCFCASEVLLMVRIAGESEKESACACMSLEVCWKGYKVLQWGCQGLERNETDAHDLPAV